jgi:hypothetical protein
LRKKLSDDVRRQLVFDKCDPVAQLKLALFQPLQLQKVGRWRGLQRCDRSIEVAVLLPQTSQFFPVFAIVGVCHRFAKSFGQPIKRDVPRGVRARIPVNLSIGRQNVAAASSKIISGSLDGRKMDEGLGYRRPLKLTGDIVTRSQVPWCGN